MPRNPYGRSFPTDRKRELVGHVDRGLKPAQIAKAMGIERRTVSHIMKQDAWVRQELEEVEERRRDERRIDREKCEDIVLKAVDLAESIESPGDMIRGAGELAKLNGLYAPEEKKLVIEGSMEHMHKEFEQMSDAQLLKLLDEEQHEIEGEFERLDDGE